jgi:hypothetical protein
MATPKPSGLIRWTTESDPDGSDSSRITPVLLEGPEPVSITPNWVWSPKPMKGAFEDLDFGRGKTATKALRKIRDLATGLGLSVAPDIAAGESVIYELRFGGDGSRYVQGAYAEFRLGNALEHVLISGEPGTVLAGGPETVSIVLGGCNGSSRATISTNPEGRRTSFQLGAYGAEGNADEYIVSAGFDQRLSFYEDNLAHLAATFAGNAMVHSPESIRYSVVIDVPWRAYWLYMLSALQQEQTSARAYKRWRDEVTRRCRLGSGRTVDVLRMVLGERFDQTEIIDEDEFAPLDGILQAMEPGRAPDIQVLVDTMRASGDELWNLLLDPELRSLVKVKGKFLEPELRTVQELCGTSYVAAVLRRMLAGAVMSVNDYVETTIEQYVQAWTPVLVKHGKLAFRGTSFAAYPFSHFVPLEEGGVMYRKDPGHIVTVNDRNGISGFPHGWWVDPVDLLPGSYLR